VAAALGTIWRLGVKELWSLARDPVMLALVVYAFSGGVYMAATAQPDTLSRATLVIVDEDRSPLSLRIRGAAHRVAPELVDRTMHGWEGMLPGAAGIVLAVVSGAVTSGLGYALWYTALRELSAMRAATVQLSVPLITAIGAVVFLAEPVTLRLMLASVAILGGIALVLAARTNK